MLNSISCGSRLILACWYLSVSAAIVLHNSLRSAQIIAIFLVYLLRKFDFAQRMQYSSIPCKIPFFAFLYIASWVKEETDTSLTLPLLMKSFNDTETWLGSPWALMSVWMAAYHCTMGIKKIKKSPQRRPIETLEGLEKELSALLFRRDAIQVS